MDSVYDQLEHAMAEAEKARWEAYRETVRRRKAEKDLIDAICKVVVVIFCRVFKKISYIFLETDKKKISILQRDFVFPSRFLFTFSC